MDYIVRNWLAGGTAPVVVNDTVTGTGNNQFDYHGNWSTATGPAAYMQDDHFSKTTNDYYLVRFNGTQIKFMPPKVQYRRSALIPSMGARKPMLTVTPPARQDQVPIYTSPVLTAGPHTLKVRVTGTKNGSSSDYFITADKVEIFSGNRHPNPTTDSGPYFNTNP